MNKLFEPSINEKKDIQRAEQFSYDAINGQRKQDFQQREGMTMLGQLYRGKPLSEILKETMH